MVKEEENARRSEEVVRERAHLLADLPGDPDAEPLMYRCPEHGVIPPEDVNWYPDLQPRCPHCGQPLQAVSGREA